MLKTENIKGWQRINWRGNEVNLLSPINHDQTDDEDDGERRKQGTAQMHGVPPFRKSQCGPLTSTTTFTAAEEAAYFQYTPVGKIQMANWHTAGARSPRTGCGDRTPPISPTVSWQEGQDHGKVHGPADVTR